MQQHPIPQNVSKYQFRLIGDMTIKQFAFLGGGIILAFLAYKFPLLPTILRLPFAFAFAASGAMIAFVPYEERTLDIWIVNFFKSIYTPTQFLWKKRLELPDYFNFKKKYKHDYVRSEFSQNDKTQLEKYINSLNANHDDPFSKVENQKIQQINNLFNPNPVSFANISNQYFKTSNNTPHANSSLIRPSQQPIVRIPSLTQVSRPTTAPVPQAKINNLPPTHDQVAKTIQDPKSQPAITINNPVRSAINIPRQQVVFKQPFAQKQTPQIPSQNTTPDILPNPVVKPKQETVIKIDTTQQINQKPTIKIQAAPSLTPPIKMKSLFPDKNPKKIEPQYLSDIQMPINPDVANTIVGITIDTHNKLITNAILEVLDKNNLPIRAFKSNAVGQFFVSTPIKNGTYTINTEHPDYIFDTIKFEASGKIIAPLKVVGKPKNNL
ncbi:hypothetical protein GYA19_01410 [Candidatus Beckwithbacteria bacterium]|nr:hypothetical protein [Candidatus Beckwithbacteria bacterium]